jgi:hypothetical protein
MERIRIDGLANLGCLGQATGFAEPDAWQHHARLYSSPACLLVDVFAKNRLQRSNAPGLASASPFGFQSKLLAKKSEPLY